MRERPIAFYPQLARELGSINDALVYQQLWFWSDKGASEDGYIYKTVEELELETTVGEKGQRGSITRLINRGWLLQENRKMSDGRVRRYFKAIYDIYPLLGKNDPLPREGVPPAEGGFPLYTESTTEKIREFGNSHVSSSRHQNLPPISIVEVSDSTEESKPPRKPRDTFALGAAKVWHRKCKAEYGREPSGGLAKAMKVISEARKLLTEEQVKEKMMDWFKEEKQEEHEMMQITRCFSSFQIDKYLSNV